MPTGRVDDEDGALGDWDEEDEPYEEDRDMVDPIENAAAIVSTAGSSDGMGLSNPRIEVILQEIAHLREENKRLKVELEINKRKRVEPECARGLARGRRPWLLRMKD